MREPSQSPTGRETSGRQIFDARRSSSGKGGDADAKPIVGLALPARSRWRLRSPNEVDPFMSRSTAASGKSVCDAIEMTTSSGLASAVALPPLTSDGGSSPFFGPHEPDTTLPRAVSRQATRMRRRDRVDSRDAKSRQLPVWRRAGSLVGSRETSINGQLCGWCPAISSMQTVAARISASFSPGDDLDPVGVADHGTSAWRSRRSCRRRARSRTHD